MKLHIALYILFPILLLGLSPEASAKDTPKYKVIFVVDGDTFIATDGNIKFKVRIAAMDAPEKGQPYGRVAKNRLSQMLLKKEIEISSIDKGIDRYGRVLGKVTLNGKDIAMDLIREGLATYYRPFCKDYPADPSTSSGQVKDKYNYDPRSYIEAENKARKLKKNMWSDGHAMLPCRYRRLYK